MFIFDNLDEQFQKLEDAKKKRYQEILDMILLGSHAGPMQYQGKLDEQLPSNNMRIRTTMSLPGVPEVFVTVEIKEQMTLRAALDLLKTATDENPEAQSMNYPLAIGGMELQRDANGIPDLYIRWASTAAGYGTEDGFVATS